MTFDGPFQKLENKLSQEKGVTDPAALAAHIGMEKMGKKAFEAKSHGEEAGRDGGVGVPIRDADATDVEFFESANGYIHPIRGTKGYSKKKAAGDADMEVDAHPIGVTNVAENRGWNDSVTNMEMNVPPVGNLGNPINNGDMDLPWEVNPEQSFAEAEVGFNNPRGDGSMGMLNEGTMKAQPMEIDSDGRAWSADEINHMNDTPVPAGQLNWASGDYQFLPEAPNAMVREVTAIDCQDRWGRG